MRADEMSDWIVLYKDSSARKVGWDGIEYAMRVSQASKHGHYRLYSCNSCISTL
jgi:hypothetical protein